MAITTSSGERYDSLESFIGHSPNEIVDDAFNAMNAVPMPSSKPVIPITNPNVNSPTQKGDWESEVITDVPPMDYGINRSDVKFWKDYKTDTEGKRDLDTIMDVMGFPPKNVGTPVVPGELNWERSRDLGKRIVYSQNDNTPKIDFTIPYIRGGLGPTPKPANDNDKRKKF